MKVLSIQSLKGVIMIFVIIWLIPYMWMSLVEFQIINPIQAIIDWPIMEKEKREDFLASFIGWMLFSIWLGCPVGDVLFKPSEDQS